MASLKLDARTKCCFGKTVMFVLLYSTRGLVYNRTLPLQEGITWNILSRLLICDLETVIFLGNDPEVCTARSFLYHYIGVCIITRLNDSRRNHPPSTDPLTYLHINDR